jgi:hypothetical protein
MPLRDDGRRMQWDVRMLTPKRKCALSRPKIAPAVSDDELTCVDDSLAAEDRSTFNLGNGGRWVRPAATDE